MATSGTYSFNLDMADIIEEAYERCGLELSSGYDFKSARRSIDLLFLEWQNIGLNLWTVQDATVAMVAGVSAYPLSSEQLDVIEASCRTNAGTTSQSDISMTPLSISSYAQQTNKLTQGRPLNYWLEKAPSGVTMNVWPVPDSSDYSIHYYYMTRIEDTGNSAENEMSIPIRFLPVLIAGLAYYLSLKKAVDRTAILKQIYDEAFTLAADADRNKASWRLVPGGYA